MAASPAAGGIASSWQLVGETEEAASEAHGKEEELVVGEKEAAGGAHGEEEELLG